MALSQKRTIRKKANGKMIKTRKKSNIRHIEQTSMKARKTQSVRTTQIGFTQIHLRKEGKT
jgi:hypothetical protein